MKREEVYSWRLSSEMKTALERAARQRGKSIAQLLEQLVGGWLQRAGAVPGEEDEQSRLHDAAARWYGKIRGGDPHRSERAGQKVRERLRKQRAR